MIKVDDVKHLLVICPVCRGKGADRSFRVQGGGQTVQHVCRRCSGRGVDLQRTVYELCQDGNSYLEVATLFGLSWKETKELRDLEYLRLTSKA